ncbi:fibronectin type III domain protein [mine drainage metagenome]|uniref:Fibronectin type III domain protein n=1 Tax=mine drainage metagenome TaxID=410659 RepID=A0A1J5PJY0_9ZZZZ
MSALSLSGGGQSATGVYGANTDQTWHADMQMGTTAPSASTVYTATVMPKTGTATTPTFTVRAAGFNTAFVSNVQPANGANVTAAQPVFSWSAPATGAAYTYGVEVYAAGTMGNTNNYVWSAYNLGGTSVTYAGPPLVPGTTYQANIQSQQYDNTANATYGAGVMVTFCFQCSGTGGGTSVNFDQLFISRNTGAFTGTAAENFSVALRFPRAQGDGLAGYSIQCPNMAPVTGQFGVAPIAAGPGYEWANVMLGTTQPATPFNCTSAVTTTAGATNTVTFTVDGFAAAAAYPAQISLAANTNVTSLGPVTFANPMPSTTVAQANIFSINPDGSLGQQLWFVAPVTSPVSFTGANLVPNTNYALALATVTGSSAKMLVAQVFVPFCYQCNGTGGGTGSSVNVVPGWNLLGNSNDVSVDVATVFGDKTKVTTVWKWVPATSRWAFYAPSMSSTALATYAASKQYDVLTTIAGGEGFWVNALNGFSATLPAGTAISSGSFAATLGTGWSLIATGDNMTPRAFDNVLSPTPPTAGTLAAPVLTTLWAWDSGKSNWYFYAPSLDNTNGLGSYIASKQYLDFGTTGTLSPGVGFWVNKP